MAQANLVNLLADRLRTFARVACVPLLPFAALGALCGAVAAAVVWGWEVGYGLLQEILP